MHISIKLYFFLKKVFHENSYKTKGSLINKIYSHLLDIEG